MNVRPSVIIIENKKLLTLKYIYGGVEVYALPGGNLEFGEKMEVALARELTEELNIETEIGALKFTAQVFRNKINTIHFVFEGNITMGSPKLNPEETTALTYAWLNINDIKSFELYPNISEQIFKKYILGQKTEMYLGEITQIWH